MILSRVMIVSPASAQGRARGCARCRSATRALSASGRADTPTAVSTSPACAAAAGLKAKPHCAEQLAAWLVRCPPPPSQPRTWGWRGDTRRLSPRDGDARPYAAAALAAATAAGAAGAVGPWMERSTQQAEARWRSRAAATPRATAAQAVGGLDDDARQQEFAIYTPPWGAEEGSAAEHRPALAAGAPPSTPASPSSPPPQTTLSATCDELPSCPPAAPSPLPLSTGARRDGVEVRRTADAAKDGGEVAADGTSHHSPQGADDNGNSIVVVDEDDDQRGLLPTSTSLSAAASTDAGSPSPPTPRRWRLPRMGWARRSGKTPRDEAAAIELPAMQDGGSGSITSGEQPKSDRDANHVLSGSGSGGSGSSSNGTAAALSRRELRTAYAMALCCVGFLVCVVLARSKLVHLDTLVRAARRRALARAHVDAHRTR
eukprot:scaffold1123_cov347-Prasinococcus_capsulatus_cf.AAC.7